MQKIRKNSGLGQKIRALRMAAGMTQEQVAAKMQLQDCEISRSIYAQIESGQYNIRVQELIALKSIFHTDYNAFFQELEET